MSASLPTLRPLFKSIFDASVTFTTGQSRSRKETGEYYGNGSNMGLGSYVGKGCNPQSRLHGTQNIPLDILAERIAGNTEGTRGIPLTIFCFRTWVWELQTTTVASKLS